MSSSTPQQQLIAYIHHERQEPGSMLCAQHALNALLQGQYYDASQLAQIAAELDQLEASELGLSAADIASRDRSSLNMDDTGFFSASVLERALQVWGISISNWRSAEMRSRHNAPEQEKAFVLNLDSHWFTIRSFGSSSKFWYNLNSFLPEPSWIGKNYLGTLLHTAESEGYTVFVVQASEGSAGQGLRESDADQIADHLPPPGAAASAASSTTQTLGLRPESNAKASSSSALDPQTRNNALGGGFGFDDDEEDPELQAALRASLAQSSAASKDAPDTPSRSRVRPVRTATDDGFSGGNGSMVETDADIDAIAPSRRRHRAQLDDAVDEELRRAMEMSMSSSSHPSRTSSSSGHRAQAASSSSGPSSSSAANRPLGRRKRRAQERQSGLTRDEAIDLDDSREDGGSSDYEELAPASLSHRSPFLSPAMMAANRNNEDVEEIMDDDENIPSDDEHVDAFSVPGAPEASALIGPRRDRHYDDEDAELQAALAASLGDTEAAARFATANPDYRHPLREEETQAVPEDVDRISRMREKARRKAREDEERQQRLARGEVEDEPEAQAPHSGKEAAKAAEDEDDEASEAEEVSAEEMRRRRLARFG